MNTAILKINSELKPYVTPLIRRQRLSLWVDFMTLGFEDEDLDQNLSIKKPGEAGF